MKTLNKEELEKKAKEVFENYPKAKKVGVTDDGMAFIVDQSDLHLKSYAKKNKHGKELEITYFTNELLKDDENGEDGKGKKDTKKQ